MVLCQTYSHRFLAELLSFLPMPITWMPLRALLYFCPGSHQSLFGVTSRFASMSLQGWSGGRGWPQPPKTKLKKRAWNYASMAFPKNRMFTEWCAQYVHISNTQQDFFESTSLESPSMKQTRSQKLFLRKNETIATKTKGCAEEIHTSSNTK